MQSSDLPTKFTVPFADQAGPTYTHQVPTPSQIGVTPGAASMVTGFPPSTFQSVAAGGLPPSGQDVNGILNQMSAWIRWLGAGGTVAFDAVWAAAVGGYPLGAIVRSATSPLLSWVNTIEANASNPDLGGSNWLRVTPAAAHGLAFFASSNALVVPDGVFFMKLEGWGPGGGGSGNLNGVQGGCGGGGAWATKRFSVVPGQVITFICPAGGPGGVNGGNNNGQDASPTEITIGGTTYQIPGGFGGIANSQAVSSGGLLAAGFDASIRGGTGGTSPFVGSGTPAAIGGASPRGGPGGSVNQASGEAGITPGGGGGAGMYSAGTSSGGKGGDGGVLFDW